MRKQFTSQLSQLNNSLIEMGALIENSIALAVKALILQDKKMAEEAISADLAINEKEKEIEALCIKLILHQQPIARDLRMISAALKMITDMERIGDHAADISEITILLSEKKYIKNLDHIPQMAEAAIKMVTDSIDAYVKKDSDLAKHVIQYDDIIDNLFIKIKDDLIDLIHKDKNNGEQALDLLMVAKYFERIGDHAVNIAEWAIFSINN